MKKISKRQQDILTFIKDEVKLKGYPPSVREIGEAVGLASSSTVHGHLARLESKGYIRRDPTETKGDRSIGSGRSGGTQIRSGPRPACRESDRRLANHSNREH